MNNKIRKRVRDIAFRIYELSNELEILKGELEDIKFNEDEKYDNLPESLQEAEIGCSLQEYSENLEDVIDMLDETDWHEITSSLENIAEQS